MFEPSIYVAYPRINIYFPKPLTSCACCSFERNIYHYYVVYYNGMEAAKLNMVVHFKNFLVNFEYNFTNTKSLQPQHGLKLEDGNITLGLSI